MKTELAALYSLKEQPGPRRDHCDLHSDLSVKFLSKRNWQSLLKGINRRKKFKENAILSAFFETADFPRQMESQILIITSAQIPVISYTCRKYVFIFKLRKKTEVPFFISSQAASPLPTHFSITLVSTTWYQDCLQSVNKCI